MREQRRFCNHTLKGMAALLASPEAALFVDVIRRELGPLGIAREERFQLTRSEAAAALQAVLQQPSEPAAAAPAKGKSKKAAAEPEPTEPTVKTPSKADIDCVTRGEALVVFIDSDDAWKSLHERLGAPAPASDGGLRAIVADAIVAAAEEAGETMDSVAEARAAVAHGKHRASQPHLFAAATADAAAQLRQVLERAVVRSRSDEERRAERAARKARAQDDWVAIAPIMTFLFPEDELHPRSTGRLVALAQYGPLDAHGRLRGGAKRTRPISAHELHTLISQLEEEDIIAVFAGRGALTPAERAELLAEVADASFALPNIGRRQAAVLLRGAGPQDEAGRVRFAAVQRAVLAARERRRRAMRDRFRSLAAAAEAGRQAAAEAAASGAGGSEAKEGGQAGKTVEFEAPPPRFGRTSLRTPLRTTQRQQKQQSNSTRALGGGGGGGGGGGSSDAEMRLSAVLADTTSRAASPLDASTAPTASLGRTLRAAARARRQATRVGPTATHNSSSHHQHHHHHHSSSSSSLRKVAVAQAAQAAMGGGRLHLQRAAAASVTGSGFAGRGWARGATTPFLSTAVRAAASAAGGGTARGGGRRGGLNQLQQQRQQQQQEGEDEGVDGAVEDEAMGAVLANLDKSARSAASASQAARRAAAERRATMARAAAAGKPSAALGVAAERSPEREGLPSKTAFLDVSRKRGPNGLARTLEHVMAKNTHQISLLGVTSNHKDMSINARLLRREPPGDEAGWDSFTAFSKPHSRIYKRRVV